MESPVSHTIMAHGTDDQRLRFVSGDADYCLAFSEADHGSDLAGVETLGEIVGDEVHVTGVKVWLARADRATAALVLCRTEPTAPRHQDLSCVLVRLRDNNVTLRPQRDMAGETRFFEAVFDGARAPLDDIIGGRGNGWRVALSTLQVARSTCVSSHLELEAEFWDIVEVARRRGRDRDPVIRQQLAWAYAQTRILQLQYERGSNRSGSRASLSNVLWTEYRRRLGEIAMDVIGPDSLLRPDGETYATSRWQHLFLASRADTISSGTAEIQRTIIAEHLLGLPK